MDSEAACLKDVTLFMRKYYLYTKFVQSRDHVGQNSTKIVTNMLSTLPIRGVIFYIQEVEVSTSFFERVKPELLPTALAVDSSTCQPSLLRLRAIAQPAMLAESKRVDL